VQPGSKERPDGNPLADHELAGQSTGAPVLPSLHFTSICRLNAVPSVATAEEDGDITIIGGGSTSMFTLDVCGSVK